MDLDHRHSAAAFCMFYKIRCNPNHDLVAALLRVHVPERLIILLFQFIAGNMMFLGVVQCYVVGRLFLRVCSFGIPWMNTALLLMV